jgi:hypothetical protein
LVTERDYAGFLDQLYGAAVEPDDWQPVITRFADLIGGAKAWMPTLGVVTGVGGGVVARIDPAMHAVYNAHYASLNPFVRRYATGPWPLTVMTDEDSFDKDELVRTEYFNDFLKPQDIHSMVIIRLGRHDGVQATLNATRPQQRGQFGRADLDVARRLQPHVIRAYNLSRRFADLGAFASGLAGAIDRSLHGVLLLDGAGRIRHANRIAEALLKEGDGPRRRSGRRAGGRPRWARR